MISQTCWAVARGDDLANQDLSEFIGNTEEEAITALVMSRIRGLNSMADRVSEQRLAEEWADARVEGWKVFEIELVVRAEKK